MWLQSTAKSMASAHGTTEQPRTYERSRAYNSAMPRLGNSRCRSQTGTTARLISSHRPQVPVLALSPRIETVRRCGIYWGVRAELQEEPDDTTALLDVCAEAAKRAGLCEPGDKIGITAGLPVGRAGGTNLFKVQVVD